MGRILSNEKSKNTVFYQLLFRKYYSMLIVYNDKHVASQILWTRNLGKG